MKPGTHHTYVADGTHAGVRWYVARLACGAQLVSMVGEVGQHPLFRQEEMPDACRETVGRLAANEVAAVQARASAKGLKGTGQ